MKNIPEFNFNEFIIKGIDSSRTQTIETDNGHRMTAKRKGFIRITINIFNDKTNEIVCLIKSKNFLDTRSDICIIRDKKIQSIGEIQISNKGLLFLSGALLLVEDNNGNRITIENPPTLHQMLTAWPSKVTRYPVFINDVEYGFLGHSHSWRNKSSCFFKIFDKNGNTEKMPFMGILFLAGVLWAMRHNFLLSQ